MGDIVPTLHNFVGGEVELIWRVAGTTVATGARLGGTRIGLSAGTVGAGGRVDEVSWRLMGALGRRVRLSEAADIEWRAEGFYGEARSWVKDVSQPYDGPHNFFGGGGLSAAVIASRRGFRPYGRLSWGICRGHSGRAGLVTRADWFGPELSAAVGLEF